MDGCGLLFGVPSSETSGGERSTHVDCLEWEKGREVSFNSASLFFTKVASGNVGVMRSRDLKTLQLGEIKKWEVDT